MRKIIKQAGKYYPEETTIGVEITAMGIQDKLTETRAAKDAALAERTELYDRIIAELESDLAAISVFVAAE